MRLWWMLTHQAPPEMGKSNDKPLQPQRTVMHFCGYIFHPGCYLAAVKVHRSAPFALMELTRQVIPYKGVILSPAACG